MPRKSKYETNHITDADIRAAVVEIVGIYRAANGVSDLPEVGRQSRAIITKLQLRYVPTNTRYFLQMAGRSAFSLSVYEGHLMEDIGGVLLPLSEARLELRRYNKRYAGVRPDAR